MDIKVRALYRSGFTGAGGGWSFSFFKFTFDGRAVFIRVWKSKATIKHATLHAGIASPLFYFHAQPFNFVRASPCAGHVGSRLRSTNVVSLYVRIHVNLKGLLKNVSYYHYLHFYRLFKRHATEEHIWRYAVIRENKNCARIAKGAGVPGAAMMARGACGTCSDDDIKMAAFFISACLMEQTGSFVCTEVICIRPSRWIILMLFSSMAGKFSLGN